MFILKYFNEGCVFQSLSICGENVSNLSLQEMLKKCHLCMESIVQAKDRQAAEANKNASILLEELDLEKVMEFFTWSPFSIILLFLPFMYRLRGVYFCSLLTCITYHTDQVLNQI